MNRTEKIARIKVLRMSEDKEFGHKTQINTHILTMDRIRERERETNKKMEKNLNFKVIFFETPRFNDDDERYQP